MKEAVTIKSLSITGFSVITSFISSLFGGWSMGLRCLLICMVVDMLTGVIVAAFCKKSKKTESGALSSTAGAKGIAKKIMILCLIVVCNQIDLMLQTTVIRDTATIAFATNEILSIIENAGLMGIKIPKIIMKSIDVLNTKIEKENEKITEEKGENELC